MRILFHITSPPPRISGTDALYQEVEQLQSNFGGEIVRWYPFQKYTRFFPPFLYGIHQIVNIRRKEADCDIHHIFHSRWYYFPLIRLLKKPIIYSISGGLDPSLLPRPVKNIHLLVSSEREKKLALEKGWVNVSIAVNGIDINRFLDVASPPSTDKFFLLAGSAPWTSEQFSKKGFDLLLDVMQQNPTIHLICLWRGILYNEWMNKIEKAGLLDRIDVYNQFIDITRLMNQIHASIVMATDSDIVKAWPHSLLESIASCRPVLLNNKIPMADFVQETGCGIVMEKLQFHDLERALKEIINQYDTYQKSACIAKERISISHQIRTYRNMYEKVLNTE